MKHWKRYVAAALCLLLAAVPALAAKTDGAPAVSLWARDEVNQAESLGLVPDSIRTLPDYRAFMTREQFRALAMEYAAVQMNCNAGGLDQLVDGWLAVYDQYGNRVAHFTDGSRDDDTAYYLGIVEGRGNRLFDPKGLVTRQEAAVMLTRTHNICGGALPDAAETNFSDRQSIASWAQESARLLSLWQVMNGMPDGTFAPENSYTVEQGIVTFLRLYQNAPDTRYKGTLEPRFTYEDGLGCVKEIAGRERIQETMRLDGEKTTLVRLDMVGMMRGTSTLLLLDKEGGVREADLGVWLRDGKLTPDLALENSRFSADGKTFLCDVTLPSDCCDPVTSAVTFPAGTYHCTVDVASGEGNAVHAK